MEETMRLPKPGDIYRHFKGNKYEIVTLAEDTETGETLVIYKALYGEGKVFARELHMFLEKIDTIRYPGATQTHRFEPVQEKDAAVDEKAAYREKESSVSGTNAAVPADADTYHEKEVAMATEEADEGSLHPMLLQFLDAETYEERLNILELMHNRKILTEDMLRTMAITLDIQLPDSDPEDQYEQVQYALNTRKKFETTRLR